MSYFVSVGWNRDVFVWLDRKMDSIHYARPRRLAGHTEDIMCVAFCPPNLLCTGSYDGSIIVHNIEYGTLTRRVPPPTRNEAELDAVDFVRSVGVETLGIVDPQRAVLPDRCLICGTSDGYLRLYSVSDMRLIDEVRACTKRRGRAASLRGGQHDLCRHGRHCGPRESVGRHRCRKALAGEQQVAGRLREAL